MKTPIPGSGLLIRYLLGELPEEECLRLEQDCLENDQLFEQLEALEAELTDDYVRGVLHGRRRQAFEKRVLNAPGSVGNIDLARLITARPRRRSQLDGLKAWMASVVRFLASLRQHPPTHRARLRLLEVSAIAAILALAIAVGWRLKERWSFHSAQSAAVPTDKAQSTPAPTPRKPSDGLAGSQPSPMAAASKPARTSLPAPLIAAFTLTAGGTRSFEEEGNANQIRIPSGATRVRFKIELPSSAYETYQASLKRVEGEQLFVKSNITPRRSRGGVYLLVELPANQLPRGTSMLTVTGVTQTSSERVGVYALSVSGR